MVINNNTRPESNTEESHKNESFLKSAWHKLTHKHDKPFSTSTSTASSDPSKDGKASDKEASTSSTTTDEPKKASGSG
jgi:molecular chaperone DnaJ